MPHWKKMSLAFPAVVLLLGAGAAPAAEDEALARARRVLAAHPVVDGHNDLPWAIREDPDAPGDVAAYDLRARTKGHTDLERLREGGVGGQFWSVYVPGDLAGGLRAGAARADRRRPTGDRPLSRPPRPRRDGGRGRAGHEGGTDRLAPRDRGRARDRELAGGAAGLLRPRGAVHDPHPREDDRLGRLRDRHGSPRRPHPLRRGGRARDEPAGDAGGPLPRLGRDDGGRAARLRGAGRLLALLGAGGLRPPRGTSPTPSSRG